MRIQQRHELAGHLRASHIEADVLFIGRHEDDAIRSDHIDLGKRIADHRIHQSGTLDILVGRVGDIERLQIDVTPCLGHDIAGRILRIEIQDQPCIFRRDIVL